MTSPREEPLGLTRPGLPSSRRAVVVAVYVVAVGLGYLIGAKGVPPFHPAPASPALARTRVGWVMSQPDPQAKTEAWDALAADTALVRESWPPAIRKVFDLVAAVRGLKTGGRSDWTEAGQLCRALKWSRCDQASLEELRVRSRP